MLGLRHSGKSTLLRNILDATNYYSLDDQDLLEDARHSAKHFLAKVGAPAIIDEAQKAPALFDALKHDVDLKRVPGRYFLTGSSQFSSKLGIRESLTGRIGILRLYPFTLAEAHQKELEAGRNSPLHSLPSRFKTSSVSKQLTTGALPVPLFTRDETQRKQYYSNWFDTTLFRDLARVGGRSYDPDRCVGILRQMGVALAEGEIPTLKHFREDSRTLRRYLEALEMVFLIRKLPCHEAGVGLDGWLPTDCGLASHIMGSAFGEGATLSLARVFVLNEILAINEYLGTPIRLAYFKSPRGTPVELVWNNIPIKVSNSIKSQLSYDERSLLGGMKRLKSKTGILVTRFDEAYFEKTPPKRGVTRETSDQQLNFVPWTFWS